MRVGAERGGAPVGVSQQPAAADAGLPQSGVIAPKVQTAPRAYQGFQEGSAGSRCTPEAPGHPLWTPCFQLVGHQHNPIFSTQIPSCPENSARRCGRRGQGSPGLACWCAVECGRGQADCSWKSTQYRNNSRDGYGQPEVLLRFSTARNAFFQCPGMKN